MKTILASTYAVNPYKGSEDGMGWNFIIQIAKHNKVIAVTRENNRYAIEQFMQEHHDVVYSNIKFIYFDLPYWMRFWKKGSRGAMLYYLLWQYFIVSFIKQQKLSYDIVHNVNFHNDWTPSFLWKLGKPLVWGPVGHHPFIPAKFLKMYSIKHFIKDRLIWLVKLYFWNLSYHLNKTKNMASHIFCMNYSVPVQLKLRKSYSVTPSVATQDLGWIENPQNEYFTVISAGRFVPLKGFDLTIQAFAKLVNDLPAIEKPKCRLVLVGSGPQESVLRKIVAESNLQNQVQFVSWIAREDLLNMMKSASAFLFPSHEGAGMVVAEALSFGLPVVCLDNEGPGAFINDRCGIKVVGSTYHQTINKLGAALHLLFSNPRIHQEMRIQARQRFKDVFHWDRRGEQLQLIYQNL